MKSNSDEWTILVLLNAKDKHNLKIAISKNNYTLDKHLSFKLQKNA